MNAKETLETYIDEGKDWECKQISIRGGSILWMPRTARQLPTLAVEINPIDEQGSQMKMKGIMIRNQRELKALRRVISDSGVVNLVEALASVVPVSRGRKGAGSRRYRGLGSIKKHQSGTIELIPVKENHGEQGPAPRTMVI